MTAFRLLLIAIFVAIMAYTVVVIAHHGADIGSVFFGDIARLTWPGAFNLDFSFFLLLAALWIGWRHQFSLPGLAMAALVFCGGSAVLAPYLLVISLRAKGNMAVLLMGAGRANA